MALLVALTQVFLLLTCLGQLSLGDITVARTTKGLVRGYIQGQTVRFLGIPYATAQRFQFPNTNVSSWDGIRNSTQPGPQCYQLCPGIEANLYCVPQMQEECLTLNIYRPVNTLALGQAFPVVVYLHGGDFSSGSGSAPVYDGDYFASRGRVIVVTFNYRLGAFGFLSIFGRYGDASGNFGLRDQQAALAWISRNIAAFQGDPNRVTVMGDGAGCVSAVSHLALPASQHLFHSVILQSCPLNIPYRNKTEARVQAEVFANMLNCRVNDVTCYRFKSANEILRAQLAMRVNVYTTNPLLVFYPWGPSIDDDQVLYHPIDVFKELSRFSDKPVLMGTVANEGAAFVYKRFPLPLAQDAFYSIIRQITPQPRNFFAPTNGDMRETLADFIQEYVFVCPTLYAAKQISKRQRSSSLSSSPNSQFVEKSGNKVWIYEFFKPSFAHDNQLQMTASALWASLSSTDIVCERMSCHGSDIRTLFNSETLPVSERQILKSLSRLMVRYWSNFAWRDNVNGGITSRAHLRNLLRQYSSPLENSPSLSRSRVQRINFRPDVISPAKSRLVIQSALVAFKFWPNYAAGSSEESSVMLLQNPPLMVAKNQWEAKCKAMGLATL